MPVATGTPSDENGSALITPELTTTAGDGFPPPPPRGQALRGNDGSGALQSIFVPTTGGGVAAVYFRSNDYGLVKAAWGDENGAA